MAGTGHAILLDFDPEVRAFASQPFWLRWRDVATGRAPTHAPDYFARLADGGGLVIDCRPADRVDERSAVTFAATRRACELVGWRYRLIGEIDPVRVANLRWLAGYRHGRYGCGPAEAQAVRSAFWNPARHTFASAVTRRQTANRPAGPFTPSFAARPGEQAQIDSTPIDVLVLLEWGMPVRADLIAVDVATRTVCAAVLRPVGTKAVDAALLLARMLVAEPIRPGWSAARMSA